MTVDHFNALDTTRDLEAAGIERPHAEAIARTVGRAVVPLATKADIQRLESTLRGDFERRMRQHRASTKADSERLESTLQGDFDRRMEQHEAWTRAELANLRADMYRALWIQGAGIVAVVAALKLLP